jgi:hypothetical protein
VLPSPGPATSTRYNQPTATGPTRVAWGRPRRGLRRRKRPPDRTRSLSQDEVETLLSWATWPLREKTPFLSCSVVAGGRMRRLRSASYRGGPVSSGESVNPQNVELRAAR